MLCRFPVRIAAYDVTVPCGRCFECRMSRTREWTVRMVHELGDWRNSCFATLTYDDDHLPSNCGVDKAEAQRWLKRLRKRLEGRRIKYYLVGEYGSKYGRPHYHVILFGVGIGERQDIQGTWNWGMVHVGTVTRESIKYVAGYIHGALKQTAMPYPTRPFALSSQGLGKAFCLENADQIRKNLGCTIGGQHVGLPRYYRGVLGLQTVDLGAAAAARDKDLAEHNRKFVGDDDEALWRRIQASRIQHHKNAAGKVRLKDRGVM